MANVLLDYSDITDIFKENNSDYLKKACNYGQITG